MRRTEDTSAAEVLRAIQPTWGMARWTAFLAALPKDALAEVAPRAAHPADARADAPRKSTKHPRRVRARGQ